MYRPTTVRTKNAGFTIVELMIATVVFSMILLVIAYSVTKFTHDYYQGITASSTQAVARQITDTVSQAIQFSSASIAPSDTSSTAHGYFCAGGYEFIYDVGRQVNDSASTGFVQYGSGDVCNTVDHPPTSASGWATRTELLQPRMRLLKFSVKQMGSTTLWQVSIRVATGDDDQFCAASIANSCKASGALQASDFNNLTTLAEMRCKSQTSSQFCSVSELTTLVQKRVN